MRGELKGHLVTSEEARAFEESLIQRILIQAGVEASVYDPVRREMRKIKWTRKTFYQLSPETKPSGKGVVMVKERGFVRKKRDVVLDAATLVHPENYKEKSYDATPIGLGEILDHIESRLVEAEKVDYYHIIIISSPTGFTEKAVNYIQNSDQILGLISKYVTIYLVDPITGTVYYNRDDPAATANIKIAEPIIPVEKLNKVVEYLHSDMAKDR
jgi:hypothetical protein